MKNFAILILFFLAGCALNADQEVSLNNAMVSYVNSKNNGAVMSYVAFTHPNAVAFYKAKGDSVFTEKFDLSDSEYSSFLQDGNIREIESKENRIHVKYEFKSIESDGYDDIATKVIIYAVSEDNGHSWYFIEEVDYLNDVIIKPADRLIK